MKKFIAIVLFSLTALCKVTAQDNWPRHTSFGIKLGANYTTANFNEGVPRPAAPVAVEGKVGISATAALNVLLSRSFSLQTEYGYLTASATRKDLGTSYTLAYLSFPLFLKYRPMRKLHLLAGPQFDLLLKAKKRAAGTTTDVTHDTEERAMGVTGGAEYFFTRALSLTARYTKGLNHIGIGQRSNVQEYKSRQVMLTAGFYF